MRLKTRTVQGVTITESSGNVFADAGLPDAEEMLVKSTLIHELNLAVKERGLTQTQAAEALGIGQPDLSRLLRGRRWDYSVDRLLQFLAVLDEDVRIIVKSKRPDAASRSIEITYSCSGDGEGCHMAIV
jgi:predicted XRE-type DNA-binding protein